MEFTRMNVGQMRRQAMERTQAKEQQSKDYQNKIDNMSKHNVGGLYDVRAIIKSQQFKEQKNHYSVEQATNELEDLLTSNRMYTFKDVTSDFIKKVSGRDGDSFTIRETGKFISELINKIKEKYEIKD
tara:strand:+ start:353 stop:736 length:384 start_codon:yes stop_codon:yes gene_type:complete